MTTKELWEHWCMTYASIPNVVLRFHSDHEHDSNDENAIINNAVDILDASEFLSEKTETEKTKTE